MFTRIVKMEFKEEEIASFLSNFDANKETIRNFEGCEFLELYRDHSDHCVFFTYSKWMSESDLEAYRKSEFFKDIWATTKAKFRSKAQAWSVDTCFHLP